MPDPISVTRLRQDLYRLLDAVLETGQPLEVQRGGRRLLIVPADGEKRAGPFDGPVRNALACTPDELVATRFPWDGELP